MAFNEKLSSQIREALKPHKAVEKKMFGGVAYMVSNKMCMGVNKDDLMVRCTPEQTDDLLREKGVRIFDLSGKPMKGWLLVAAEGYAGKAFDKWVKVAVEGNKSVASKKK